MKTPNQNIFTVSSLLTFATIFVAFSAGANEPTREFWKNRGTRAEVFNESGKKSVIYYSDNDEISKAKILEVMRQHPGCWIEQSKAISKAMKEAREYIKPGLYFSNHDDSIKLNLTQVGHGLDLTRLAVEKDKTYSDLAELKLDFSGEFEVLGTEEEAEELNAILVGYRWANSKGFRAQDLKSKGKLVYSFEKDFLVSLRVVSVDPNAKSAEAFAKSDFYTDACQSRDHKLSTNTLFEKVIEQFEEISLDIETALKEIRATRAEKQRIETKQKLEKEKQEQKKRQLEKETQDIMDEFGTRGKSNEETQKAI